MSESVAFCLASRGYEASAFGDDFATSDPTISGRDTAGGTPEIDRRDLIRLLDLALSLLGGGGAGSSSSFDGEGMELTALRDKILRLRAWLCMLEDEVEMATHSLNQHSARATSPEYMLLRCALLFRSNQPEEAAAQTVEWIRSGDALPYDAAADAIALLCSHQKHRSALTAVNVLSERLGTAWDDARTGARDASLHMVDASAAAAASSPTSVGSELSQQYSELQERKHALLTESIPDVTAAAEHIEDILDGHCSGRRPLEDSTLRTLASRLWASGCERYAHGDLHRTCEDFERAFRFLEPSRSLPAKARAQATLAHCYLQQDRLDQAVDRAHHCLKLLREYVPMLGPSGGAAGRTPAASHQGGEHHWERASSTTLGDLRGGLRCAIGGISGDVEDEENIAASQSLAQITIVKARVKQGDVAGATAQIESLLACHHDHILLASVCEELASGGSAYHSASILILERFVEQIAELPLAPGAASAAGGVGTLKALPSRDAGGGVGENGKDRGRGSSGGGGGTGGEKAATNMAHACCRGLRTATNAIGSSEKLAAATRSLVGMRLQAAAARASPPSLTSTVASSAAISAPSFSSCSSSMIPSHAEMRAPLLADLRRIATRVARDGAAVCDDPSHIEWLADTAWQLAYLEGQHVPQDDGTYSPANQQKEGAGGDATTTMDADSAGASVNNKATAGEQSLMGESAVLAVQYCADFIQVSVDLTACLPQSEARLHAMLRGHSIICRCALRLTALSGHRRTTAATAAAADAAAAEGREQLDRASKAISAAFKALQRYSQLSNGSPPTLTSTASPPSGGAAAEESLASTLQVLNFEVALRRRDPSAKDVLRKLGEAESGVSPAQLRVLADLAFECRAKELAVTALEHCLSRLMLGCEPRRYEEIASVLRQLIQNKNSPRLASQPYFRTAYRLLDGYSDANAPLSTDTLQWFLAESWNKGVDAFKKHEYEEAEGWMSQSFAFSNFSPALAPWREELNEQYHVCIQLLNEEGRRSSRSDDWKQRLAQRILEADEDMIKRRTAGAA